MISPQYIPALTVLIFTLPLKQNKTKGKIHPLSALITTEESKLNILEGRAYSHSSGRQVDHLADRNPPSLHILTKEEKQEVLFSWVQTKRKLQASVHHASSGQHLTSTVNKPHTRPLLQVWGPGGGGQRMGVVAEPMSCQKAPQLRQRCRIPSLTAGASANPAHLPVRCCLSEQGTRCPAGGNSPAPQHPRGFGPWGG